jgi:hypothetical protein
MLKAGRIRALSANLLDKKGVIGVGETARKMGVPIRLIYLSNAEGYWKYSKQFKANIRSLPTDEKGIVLRTMSTWPTNKDYTYVAQRIEQYQEWLSMDFFVRRSQMVWRTKLKGPDHVDFRWLDSDPKIAQAYHERMKRKRNRK